MAEMGKQFSHLTVALGLLPGQFAGSAKLRDLVEIFVGADHAVQELEDVLWDLFSRRWLWIATGEQLDGLGDLLDEPRPSDDDEVYRELLKLKVLINVSEGDPERIIDAALAASGASLVHLMEPPPATVLVYAHGLTSTSWLSRIPEVVAGGVRTIITGSESLTPFVFGVDRDALAGGHGAELSYGDGWGESGAGNEEIGGDFVELFASE